MIRDRVRSARGIAAAALIAIAATFLRGAAPPPVDGAQTDLSYTSAAVWTVDPAHGRVHVLLNVNATSHAADSGGRRYFYPGLQLTLPLSTAEYAALDGNGQSLPLSVIATTPSGVVVNVGFRQPLYSGQSGAFELKFDLVDRGGSTDRDLRIGQDIVSFPVSAFGSPGTSGGSVTVVFPASLIVQEQFGALATSTDSFGHTVFSSGPVADSTALNAWFTASRTVPASDFRVLQVVVGPIDATLRYWADDPGWADQVARVLKSGYPVLSELIGLGDPQRTAQGILHMARERLVVNVDIQAEFVGRLGKTLLFGEVEEARVVFVVRVAEVFEQTGIDPLDVQERLEVGIAFDAPVFADA